MVQEIELDPDVALDLLDVLDDDVENMDAEQVRSVFGKINKTYLNTDHLKNHETWKNNFNTFQQKNKKKII